MYASAQRAHEYESPPQYEPPPPSLHSAPASLSSADSINAALSVFATLTPSDIGDVLHPHLSFIFEHLSTASLRSLIVAGERRQQWRQLPAPLVAHIVPFLSPRAYLCLSAASRHYRATVHQPHWQRLQHAQLTGRADDSRNESHLSLLKRSLPQCGELTLRSFALNALLLLSLDRFHLRSLHLTHCTVASSADTWLALGSSSCLRRLQRLEVEAVSGFDDDALSQLLVDDGKHPSLSLTSLHLTNLQLSSPALAALSRCFPLLAELSLAYNEELLDTAISSLASSPPPLTSLTLAHCSMLGMAALQAMKAFPEMGTLDVTGCFQLTSLVPLSPLAITSLSVAYTAITAASFTALSHLPLRHLHLSAPSPALPAWLSGNLRRSARLHLRWDEAEDDGLQWVAAMGVIDLEVKGKRVTDAGLGKLLSGYLDGGRVKGLEKDKASGRDEKVEEKKEENKEREKAKDKERDSKGKSWFSRSKPAASSAAPSPSASSSSSSSSPSAPPVAQPFPSFAVVSQPLPLVYLSSSVLPPPPLRLHSLVLRDVSVTDLGLLRCLHAFLPLGLARVEVLQCGGVTWKAVEWLMNWRREHRQDVRVLYEL